MAPLNAPALAPAAQANPPATKRCAVCGAAAEIGSATQILACGHYAFRTQGGVVVGWKNTVDMTLNLDRMVGHVNTLTPFPT